MSVPKLAVLAIALAALLAPARAAVPSVISYQGKLMQPSGAPVADGSVSITFAVYDAPTGGTALWSETNNSVQVKGGLFSVMLGSVTPIPAAVFSGSDRYFGIKVGTDAETAPRQKIASAAYAQTAGSAATAGNGVPVGGIIMWSGAATAIPAGWSLCDGTNGTPDLRGQFVIGAGNGYPQGTSGGAASVTLSVAQLPPHSHGVNDPGHSHGLSGGANGQPARAGVGTTGYGYVYPTTTGADQPYENVAQATTGISIQNTGGDSL